MTRFADITRHLHPIWQRLPAGFRRGLYTAATRRLAPAATWTPATPRDPAEPYIVAGPLSAPTGLGQAGRLALAALKAARREVSAIDLGPSLMQPEVVPLPPGLGPPGTGPGTLLLFSQPPTIAHSLAAIGRPLLRDKLRIGLWAWEIDRLPAVWTEERRLVHAVTAPSRFVRDIFAAAWDEPVRITPWPLATAGIRTHRRIRGASPEIVFGAAMDLGSTIARKNPFGPVLAFRRAFGPADPVRLMLKLRDSGSAPDAASELLAIAAREGAPIEIESGNLGPDAFEAWWGRLDVFVSLHRSEGFGLLVAEAMQRGIPTIATDWSATTDFVTAENGWPVPSRLVPAKDETERYALDGARWAEPDLDAAVALLRSAAEDPAAIARRSEAAAATIARDLSGRAFLDALEAPAERL